VLLTLPVRMISAAN